jgi:hypothetical protein
MKITRLPLGGAHLVELALVADEGEFSQRDRSFPDHKL